MSVFNVDNVPDYVLETCTAYEQGYGKGLEVSKHLNPYKPTTKCWWAWGYGFSEGARKNSEHILKDNVIVQNDNGTSVELVLLADK